MEICQFDQGDDSAILDIVFDQTSGFLYSCDKKTIKLWNVKNSQLIKTFGYSQAYLVYPTTILLKFYYLKKPNNSYSLIMINQDKEIVYNFKNDKYQDYSIYTKNDKIEIKKNKFYLPGYNYHAITECNNHQENLSNISIEIFYEKMFKLALSSKKIMQKFLLRKDYVSSIQTTSRTLIFVYQSSHKTSRISIYKKSKLKIIRQIMSQSSQYFQIMQMINRLNILYCMQWNINDLERNLISINIYTGQTNIIAADNLFTLSKYDISLNGEYLAIGKQDGMISIFKLI